MLYFRYLENDIQTLILNQGSSLDFLVKVTKKNTK